MYKIQTADYATLLTRCYDKHQPLFVSGGPGIGKSAIPRQSFREKAKELGRVFLEWSDLTMEVKKDCVASPKKYFIFADMRTSQMDTTSLTGIPNMMNTTMLENIPYSWVVYFTQPDAAGVIFFDEINLAAPIVQSITYSAIHDRVISDRRIADGVYVFAAGNRSQDKAHTFDMPLPLRDRFAEVELEHNDKEWSMWASQHGINPHLISFIQWKPSNLYNVDKVTNQKPSTPRGVVRASNLVNDVAIDSDEAHMLISISCGESFATEFQAYTACYTKLDWAAIFANPASIAQFSPDMQYAVGGGLVERYQKNVKDHKQVGQLINVMDHMRTDFAVFVFRMLKDTNESALKEALITLGLAGQVSKKYGKYLVNVELKS